MGILEQILEKSEREYISDLNGRIEEDSIKNIIHAMDISDFNMEEWGRAVSYLSGKKQMFHTVEELKEYLSKL